MRHLVVILSSLLASLALGALAAPPALGPLQFLPGDDSLAGASGAPSAPASVVPPRMDWGLRLVVAVEVVGIASLL